MKSSLIKLLFALVCLIAVFFAVDVGELVRTLRQLTWLMIVLLVALSFVMIYLSAVKWRILLSALHEDRQSLPSSLKLFGHYLVGYFVNLIFPSYVGGDLVRSMRLGKKVGQVNALGAVILERYTGLLAMVILALAFVWFVPGVTLEITFLVCGIFIMVLAGTIAALHQGTRKIFRLLPVVVAEKLESSVIKLQNGFNLVRKDSRVLGRALFLSFIYHGLTIVNTALTGYAIGWTDPNIGVLFVVVPIILLIGAIPITPQGLGIQEGAFFYFLQIAGASPAQALGVALVLRAKSYLLAILGGIIWWLDRDGVKVTKDICTKDNNT